MTQSAIFQSADSLSTLVHDLRQPVGNICLSASYLDLILENGDARARDQVRLILSQVERAGGMLDQAAAELHRLRVSHEGHSEAAEPQAAAVA
jgi:hypothetical protein